MKAHRRRTRRAKLNFSKVVGTVLQDSDGQFIGLTALNGGRFFNPFR